MGGSNHVYIRHKEHSWVPARVIESDATSAKVQMPVYENEQAILSDGGKAAKKNVEMQVNLADYPNQVLPLQNVNAQGSLNQVNDMVELPFLHEAAILYNLKARHVAGKPYTRTGDIVMAVNPYQWFHNLYTPEKRNLYSRELVWTQADRDARHDLEPHVYESSALAYKGLAIDNENQSILVSGESGAGKTETVKICMNHIAMVQAGPDGAASAKVTSPIVQRVVDSNPLLEAFGNAKTRRNDNSSRFGKYLSLQFEKADDSKLVFGDRVAKDCKLAGSKCEVYLLEKSRVVSHEQQERTFHIFYQLLAAPDEVKGQFWSKLAGTNNESFRYVGVTDTHAIEGQSDAEHFVHTIQSLALVGIKGETLDTLMKAICAVLQLGNIGFEGDADSSSVKTVNELQNLAQLMGVSEDVLNKAFTERTMTAKNESYKVPLNAEFAKDSCDALAKEIFHKAFLWLVKTINEATSAEKNNSAYQGTYGIIGLLDIFGFESFPVNSFEQLCINYANEKLQQKFNQDIFRTVKNEYQNEGIDLEDITYDDNTDVLDLIEGRTGGLLAMLNEECVRPKGGDTAFVFKAISENKNSPALIAENVFDEYQFGIRHYAGDVIYNAKSFVTKNNDTLATDLLECASQSSNAIIAGKDASKTLTRKSSGNIVAATVWTKYRGGLENLMVELHDTNSRYIRCIKPNEFKKPLMMQHEPTLDQLRSAGVISAITISRSAFPNRLGHSNVWDRFRGLFPADQKGESVETEKGLISNIDKLLTSALQHMEEDKGGRTVKAFAIGNTRTYFRAGALEFLEGERVKGFEPAAVKVQAVGRGFLVRKRKANAYIVRRNACVKIQSIVRRNQVSILVEKAKKSKKSDTLRRMKASREKRKRNKAAAFLQAIVRGNQQRVKYREALKRQQEVGGLQDQINILKAKLARAEQERQVAVKEAEDRVSKAMASLDDDDINESGGTTVAQEAKLQETVKVIDFLKRENRRLQAHVQTHKARCTKISETNKQFKEDKENGLKSCQQLKDYMERLEENKAVLERNKDVYAKQLKGYRKELKTGQQYLSSEEGIRDLYQEAVDKIVALVQEECDNDELVEDIYLMALECSDGDGDNPGSAPDLTETETEISESAY